MRILTWGLILSIFSRLLIYYISISEEFHISLIILIIIIFCLVLVRAHLNMYIDMCAIQILHY